MLITVEQLLTSEEVKICLQQLKIAEWQDGKLTAGTAAMQVKTNQQLNDTDKIAVSIRQKLLQKLQSHPLFISAALPNKIFPPKFNRYENGGHYGLHVDNSMMTLPGGEYMRTDISATIFFSAPESYEGGELMIETRYGAQAVKLDVGSMILYPSSSLHEVRPVTEGARISAFFWVQSLVKDAQQRENLFELDQCIQALTVERGAQDTQVRSLTGIYHNLLRSLGQL